MLKFIRSIMKTFFVSDSAGYTQYTGSGRSGEETAGVVAQHYGFASYPPVGTEFMTLQFGNNNYSVAESDGEMRPELEEGDTALYSVGEGDSFVGMLIQKNGNAINIMTDEGTIGITADSDGDITIDAGNGTITIDCGTGDMTINGKVSINSGALTVDV